MFVFLPTVIRKIYHRVEGIFIPTMYYSLIRAQQLLKEHFQSNHPKATLVRKKKIIQRSDYRRVGIHVVQH